MTVGEAINTVLDRVRSLGTVPYNRSFIADLLCVCESTVNSLTKSKFMSVSFSLSSQRQLYFYRSVNPQYIDIIDAYGVVGSETYRIRRALPCDLFGYNRSWFRSFTTGNIDWFTQLGRELLIIYPGPTGSKQIQLDVSVAFSQYAGEQSNMHLSDEDIELALDLCELVLIATLRLTEVATVKAKELMDKVGAELISRL